MITEEIITQMRAHIAALNRLANQLPGTIEIDYDTSRNQVVGYEYNAVMLVLRAREVKPL